MLDYIGTLPQGLIRPRLTVNLSPQSRYQVTDVLANQTDVTFKFDTGPVKHTLVAGVEFSQRKGHARHLYGPDVRAFRRFFSRATAIRACRCCAPPNFQPFPDKPQRANNPTIITVGHARPSI